ncbi:membrane protein UL148 [macacine betaherpesvirus 3]|uniref:Rh159 n=3 Tax=Rhesus cytomegalovirus (strain 68-1) TaxID=47929 RepID=I3WF06_RHCM6|nr:rh159 [macacine betaherpesvirus 3]AAP50681.1 rh159 [macacine betaherpesvirus 3]QMS44082.1 Rh159 [synthetic construct]QQL10623.1 Rh159 [Rhesus cytomegalovirus strain 68-1.2]QQL10806.1 Rh159 [Rhesus cytomegalovirus strain 68-1_FL]AFL03469.1 Rh159 [macacine betaherpesvirus 3]
MAYNSFLLSCLTIALLLHGLPTSTSAKDMAGYVHVHMLNAPEDAASTSAPVIQLANGFITCRKFTELGWALCTSWDDMECFPFWRRTFSETKNITVLSDDPYYAGVVLTVRTLLGDSLELTSYLGVRPSIANVGYYVMYLSYAKALPAKFTHNDVDYVRFAIYLHTEIDAQQTPDNNFVFTFATPGTFETPDLMSSFVIGTDDGQNSTLNFTTVGGEKHRYNNVELSSEMKGNCVYHSAIIRNVASSQSWVSFDFSLYWRRTKIAYSYVQYYFPKPLHSPEPIGPAWQRIYHYFSLLTQLRYGTVAITVVLIFLIGALLKRSREAH